ncbi:hypothetical protein B7435_23935 [Mycolicibacterium peregrinum]|uniref:Uncharacterized protein n=1 Tax=Mycolicibacterium alvei TaxID=67081 RepID=A0A6N4V4F4_9MYCO|nr:MULTISPECIES: hypothetical protein [Mycolicibacterium]MCV7003441.1 hypothetical protein [Mycolicibacterium alvei]OWL98809.1 hypothetical protein B7435_23935 [Mycolicibacterium peregrinum]BBX30612.1 hypothetical protein MALV_57370 [Mycolicibacterium alvei]
MTTNRSHKELVRAASEATGRSYAEMARLAKEFESILEKNPRLSANGLGLSRDRRTTLAQQQADFERHRQNLREGFVSVVRVLFWLQSSIGMIKTPTRSSYYLKHVAEQSVQHYVTNGEFIAAALMAGYPMKDSGGLNPLFGVRKRDVDAAVAELERLGRHPI